MSHEAVWLLIENCKNEMLDLWHFSCVDSPQHLALLNSRKIAQPKSPWVRTWVNGISETKFVDVEAQSLLQYTKHVPFFGSADPARSSFNGRVNNLSPAWSLSTSVNPHLEEGLDQKIETDFDQPGLPSIQTANSSIP